MPEHLMWKPNQEHHIKIEKYMVLYGYKEHQHGIARKQTYITYIASVSKTTLYNIIDSNIYFRKVAERNCNSINIINGNKAFVKKKNDNWFKTHAVIVLQRFRWATQCYVMCGRQHFDIPAHMKKQKTTPEYVRLDRWLAHFRFCHSHAHCRDAWHAVRTFLTTRHCEVNLYNISVHEYMCYTSHISIYIHKHICISKYVVWYVYESSMLSVPSRN